MERRRIPASLNARLIRGISIITVLTMAVGVAPFAPVAPASAGLFGLILLKALLATLALIALLGDVSARTLALAVAAAGSCHILQAGTWISAAPLTDPFAWLIPLTGALACLAAIVGLGMGAAEWEERRSAPALPRNASWQRRLLGRRAAVEGHRRPVGAIRPARVQCACDHATPRPQRIKPLKAMRGQLAVAKDHPQPSHPPVHPVRTGDLINAAPTAAHRDVLVLTAARRVAPEQDEAETDALALRQVAAR